jgi:threonine/homoserine/homoserine lactone efflux protein
MPTASTVALFCVAAMALIVVPGPAVTYVVAQTLAKGRRAGLVSALGVSTGALVHVVAATAGVSALLMSSATAFTVVKLVGAAYLIAVGVRQLLDRRADDVPDDAPENRVRGSRVYAQGVLVNVLNPKTALFFLAFLPQFVDPARGSATLQVALFGCIFVLLAAVSDSVYALVADALGRRLRTVRARRFRRLASGGIFVALGVTAAATKRAA